MKEQLMQRLLEFCKPCYVSVIDDSDAHRGHKGAIATGNSHFSVTVVSDCFDGQPLVKRHQQVYRCCESLFDSSLHALGLKTLTNNEWRDRRG